ncbi:1-deoxy-D-xylulose-5-phosphate reductoisomerase [Olivibacter sp. SDN3]|uniref:1-deoxy-D-xylulose-5-phosphate reductoisomerase n=1 Tax=Olivibacter sp. SDN3 TaxID=2764720 RepID=UPI001C9E7227|nr:1-deoxy-D-xylulose-5-phosphate reductoisomerase [Olivibacter sp. SDN3]
MKKKRIAILGATGSIGTQALSVVREHRELFDVEVLTAAGNATLLIEQAMEFLPKVVVITDESKRAAVDEVLGSKGIEVLSGQQALEEVVQRPLIDIVLTALVGFAGLKPTIAAIKSGKNIALANKETLVVAGELIMKLAEKNEVAILPVDSEHSAIYQCLVGEEKSTLEKIYLTASGGPFRGKDATSLSTITKKEALMHPNWVMGQKITIDSASLMNKGLEVIEAKWLFGLDVDQIEVVVHPQSIIHSLVQFKDGSLKAQMGLPDMKLPIQYALTYPGRLANTFERFDFLKHPCLSFEQPDTKTFANLALAFDALRSGGNMPCVLNAANEVAVAAFLRDETGFREMSTIISETLQKIPFIASPKLDDYLQTDKEARLFAEQLVTKKKKVYQIEK